MTGESTSTEAPEKPGFFGLRRKGNSRPPEPHSPWALLKIAIIRAIPVAFIVTVHDPLVRAVLFVLCLWCASLGVFNILTKRTDGWKQFVKAAVYGIGVVALTVGIASDRTHADELVSKLEEYKRQQGNYPEKLNDLVPNLLPDIRVIGLGRPLYGRDADSYLLTYRNAWESSCTYRPAKPVWTCGGLR